MRHARVAPDTADHHFSSIKHKFEDERGLEIRVWGIQAGILHEITLRRCWKGFWASKMP